MEEPENNEDQINKRLQELEGKLKEQESKIIAQETRPFFFVLNYLRYRKGNFGEDKRVRAAVINFWVKLFFSPSTLALVGGATAIVTVVLLKQQNDEVRRQNDQISQQIQIESEAFRTARRTQLIKDLKSNDQDLKQAAFFEFYGREEYSKNTSIVLDTLSLRRMAFSEFSSKWAHVKHFSMEDVTVKKLTAPNLHNSWSFVASEMDSSFIPSSIWLTKLQFSKISNSIMSVSSNENSIQNSIFTNTRIKFGSENTTLSGNIFLNDTIVFEVLPGTKVLSSQNVFINCHLTGISGSLLYYPRRSNTTNTQLKNLFLNCSFDIPIPNLFARSHEIVDSVLIYSTLPLVGKSSDLNLKSFLDQSFGSRIGIYVIKMKDLAGLGLGNPVVTDSIFYPRLQFDMTRYDKPFVGRDVVLRAQDSITKLYFEAYAPDISYELDFDSLNQFFLRRYRPDLVEKQSD